jgi:hypothetical protein
MFALQCVEDVMGGDNVGFATLERFRHAEKAYEIRAIGMEVLSATN